MQKRGLVARVPVWVRVPGIIALVLAGVLLSSMLLNAARDGGDGRTGDHTRMDGRGNHGSGGGNHGSGGTGGHGSGTHGR
jgi:hypothetical protein